MRTFLAAVIAACVLCPAGNAQDKPMPGADRMLENCIRVLKFGEINEFEKPMKQDAVMAMGMLGDERAVPILLDLKQA